MHPATILVVIAVAALAGWAFVSSRAKRRAPTLESQLLRMCRGDEAKLERLVAFEIERRPGTSRDDAIARAMRSLARDNR